MENVYGAFFVGIAVFISYLLFTEKSIFDFNNISKQLLWSRKRFFKKKEGIISFHNINKVIVENSKSSNSRPNCRVALIMNSEKIPISVAYLGNSKVCWDVAEKIRQVLEHSESDLIDDSIREMINLGSDIEAIKLIRDQKGLSLTEAKQELDRLKGNIK